MSDVYYPPEPEIPTFNPNPDGYPDVRADQLKPGDYLPYTDEYVEQRYDDSDGTWLETTNTMGYVEPSGIYYIDTESYYRD